MKVQEKVRQSQNQKSTIKLIKVPIFSSAPKTVIAAVEGAVRVAGFRWSAKYWLLHVLGPLCIKTLLCCVKEMLHLYCLMLKLKGKPTFLYSELKRS